MDKCQECTHRVDCTWNGGCEAFELDLEEHDKQIRDNTINEVMDMLKNEWTIDSILCANDKHRLIAIFKRIAEQMKGEQNE